MQILRTACTAALSIAVLAACSAVGSSRESSKPPKPSAPSFEGTYRFDFDGTQQLAGGEGFHNIIVGSGLPTFGAFLFARSGGEKRTGLSESVNWRAILLTVRAHPTRAS